MHTRMDIAMYGISASLFESTISLIKQETFRIENLISRFIPDSEISKINNRHTNTYNGIVPEVFNILLLCKKYYTLTHGLFDITANKNITGSGFLNIVFDPDNCSVTFPDNITQIDLGGIGKGFALDKIKNILIENSVQHALISFGDSSVLAMGNHPYGDCWKIGIMNSDKSAMIHEWEIHNQFLSTSCSVNGHIINPKTFTPVFSGKTVSVMSGNAAEAEAFSTALLVAGENEIEQIVHNFSDAKCVIFDVILNKPVLKKY
jgi:thiamine biosynthesis lipoprotein